MCLAFTIHVFLFSQFADDKNDGYRCYCLHIVLASIQCATGEFFFYFVTAAIFRFIPSGIQFNVYFPFC